MLLEFTVGNYLSFKDKMTFSMLPDTALSRTVDGQVIGEDKVKALSSAVVYGANASGKTNLIASLSFMMQFVASSHQSLNPTGGIAVSSFQLNHETRYQPSCFEILFFHNGIRYRYGFNVDEERVHKEWLYQDSTGKREATLFVRQREEISLGAKFGEGKGLEGRVAPNKLFLSIVAQFNGEIALEIVDKWFDTQLRVISTLQIPTYFDVTAEMMQDRSDAELIIQIMKQLDIGLESIVAEYIKPDGIELLHIVNERAQNRKIDFSRENYEIRTVHKDEQGMNIDFDFSVESAGTRRLFDLLGPIIETLRNGYTLVIDEFDNRLHPMLAYNLIRLFNSKMVNRYGAQLIIATHNTFLIDPTLFGRDQIWFTAKDLRGVTDLYSLADYKQPDTNHTERKSARFEKKYLQGRYGGVPIMGDIEETIGKYLDGIADER